MSQAIETAVAPKTVECAIPSEHERRRVRKTIAGLLEFTIIYAAITAVIAIERPFWTDELFTYHLSRIASFEEFWKALSTGADQHPPLFYMIEHVFLRVFGANELALRLPSIFGFWLASVCLFAFVARRTSIPIGFVALLTPVATELNFYATEARGYSLVLGLTAVAFLCWQIAGEQRWRRVAVPGIALFLALAVGCHYYAVLALPAFGAGELARWYRTRRFMPSTWAAFAAPMLTLALSYPVIAASRGFAGTFWAIPRWSQLIWFYGELLGGYGISVGILCCFALGVSLIACRPKAGAANFVSSKRLYPEELIAACGFLLLPVLGMILAQTVTHGFHYRYMIVAFLGVVVLTAFAMHIVTRDHKRTVSLIIGILVVWCLGIGCGRFVAAHNARVDMVAELRWTRSLPNKDLAIACSNNETFYRLWHYGSPGLRRRLVYVADPDRSLRYLKHDTVDRCILALEPWFGVHVEEYDDFLDEHPSFYLVGEFDPGWQWISRALLDDGLRMELYALRNGWTFVYRVERQEEPGGDSEETRDGDAPLIEQGEASSP